MDKKYEEKVLAAFGLNVKYEREKHRLKQKKLAEILNCSPVYISNVESGKHKISLTNALRFSQYFEKSIEYLINEK